MIDKETLRRIVPHASAARLAAIIGPLNDAMDEFGITTPERQAAFIAQIAHESGSFAYLCEIASGKAYECRADLGNIRPGDGVRFKGRGLIQITGRTNYAQCSKALYGDENVLLESPAKLEGIVDACRSAAWFWFSRGLNALADAGKFDSITRRINGGTNGQEERRAFYRVAREQLCSQP